MSESDPKLLEGLRALAAQGPREAPARVEERLLREFRQRSRARFRNRWLAVAAGAAAAGIALFAWLQPVRQAPPAAVEPAAVQAKVQPQVRTVESAAQAPASEKKRSVRQRHARGPEVALNFYRLPGADELAPIESASIVRVELPVSSLRLMGMPVSDDRAGDAVQADVLLGQDGLARGVRFVQ